MPTLCIGIYLRCTDVYVKQLVYLHLRLVILKIHSAYLYLYNVPTNANVLWSLAFTSSCTLLCGA
jgi:hypothetical protein